MDVTDDKTIIRTTDKFKPNLIIHLAALSNVDFCEKYPHQAEKINVHGTQNILKACQKINAKLIFTSSNGIFDGTQAPYSEKNIPHVAVKESVLPFSRFSGVDIILGPEMKSTGEVMGIDDTFGLAFYKSQVAANQTLQASSQIWTLSGPGTPFVVSGNFQAQSSLFKYTATSSAEIENTTYYRLELSPSAAGSPTYTIQAGTLITNDYLYIGDATNPVIVTANTNDPTLDIIGDFEIRNSATFTASAISSVLCHRFERASSIAFITTVSVC